MYVYNSAFNSEHQKCYYSISIQCTSEEIRYIYLSLPFMAQMKMCAIINCIQVLLDRVYREKYIDLYWQQNS